MSYQETTSVSWFGRIKRSFGGVVVGLLLVVGMVVLLFWNEGRAVQTARSLAEGSGLVVSVGAGAVDAGQEGALVHVSGPVETASRLSDSEFGIVATGIKLIRSAEMYQWIETKRTETETKVGGGEETITTYSYAMGWSERPQDSSNFKDPNGHTNPPMEVQGESFLVSEANLGAFDLSQRILGMIDGARPVSLTADQTEAIQQAVGAGVRASVANGGIYLGFNPQQPRVGDYRIGYELVPLGTISIVGKQTGSSIEPYQTEAGDALLMVEDGAVDAKQMFDSAMTSNTVMTWIIRIVGLMFLIFGFSLIMGPLGVIGDVIPFIGSIVRMGTGIIATFAGVLVGSVVIAFAWFWYRPITALIILIVGAAIAYGVTLLGKKKQGAATMGQPPVQPAPGA
jgi:hypothetical protein